MKRNSISILKTLTIIIAINVLSFLFYSQKNLFLQSVENDIFFHESLQFYKYNLNVTKHTETPDAIIKNHDQPSNIIDFVASQDIWDFK